MCPPLTPYIPHIFWPIGVLLWIPYSIRPHVLVQSSVFPSSEVVCFFLVLPWWYSLPISNETIWASVIEGSVDRPSRFSWTVKHVVHLLSTNCYEHVRAFSREYVFESIPFPTSSTVFRPDEVSMFLLWADWDAILDPYARKAVSEWPYILRWPIPPRVFGRCLVVRHQRQSVNRRIEQEVLVCESMTCAPSLYCVKHEF